MAVMTVKKLRKALSKLPDDLVVTFETNEVPDVSWSVDEVENRFDSFCMLKSVGTPDSFKLVSTDINRSRGPRFQYARPLRD